MDPGFLRFYELFDVLVVVKL